MTDHRVIISYSVDDGVRLVCSCGWTEDLGFDPTVEKAELAALGHRRVT